MIVNRWAQHIDLMITMHQQPGGQDGHCGNFNGVGADDDLENIQKRAGAQVAAAEQLFAEPTPTEPAAVPAPVTLADCPSDTRARAEEVCAGSTAGAADVISSTCVFDVCFGGEEFAGADAAMDRRLGSVLAAVSIQWARHPELCLDVGGGEPLNGSAVQVWECEDGHPDMQFLLPPGGRGLIRWARFPEMCLDVAGGETGEGARIQIWQCVAGHRDMQFIVPAAGGQGEIRWAVEPARCLDVREGVAASGTPVQLWTCMGGGQPNQEFLVGGQLQR
uniref:Ricin B lectin domain-containing protein n=1 Tax=Zooxanthella nutricula TaxID=1333877 RepID=A0A7S2P1T3_9DINO